MSYGLLCAICERPVNLEESKTDAHSHSVFGNCNVWTVELKKPRRLKPNWTPHLPSPMFANCSSSAIASQRFGPSEFKVYPVRPPWPARLVRANVRCKLFVAPRFKVSHHCIESLADRRISRVEDPCTLGAAPTTLSHLVEPDKLAQLSRIICSKTSLINLDHSTMRVRNVPLCSAIHLPTQQPADQKKENDQEYSQYGHTPCFCVFLLVIHP
jgi:hypothetical protein